MFRFPRNVRAQAILEKEKRLLSKLSTALPLPIPKIVFQGSHFIGYRKLEGYSLSKHILGEVDSQTRTRLTQELGHFLQVFHNAYWDDYIVPGEACDHVNFWQTVWPRVSKQLSDNTRIHAQNYLSVSNFLTHPRI